MDGTLVDSEELHWRSWRETMADEGISITHDQFLSSFGQRNDSIIPLWLGAGAAPERVQKIERAKEDRFRRIVRDAGVLPLPGAVAWVNRLSEGGWLQALPRLHRVRISMRSWRRWQSRAIFKPLFPLKMCVEASRTGSVSAGSFAIG